MNVDGIFTCRLVMTRDAANNHEAIIFRPIGARFLLTLRVSELVFCSKASNSLQ